jgi:hypothetical protein
LILYCISELGIDLQYGSAEEDPTSIECAERNRMCMMHVQMMGER